MDGSPVTRIELQKPPGGRLLRHLAIGALLGVGLFVPGSGIYGLAEGGDGSEWFLLLGLLLVFLAEVLRRHNLPQLRAGAIEAAGSKLMIEYPPLMRTPLGLRPRIHEEDLERLARINAGEIQVEREQETGA